MLQKNVLNELAIWFWLVEWGPLVLCELAVWPVFGLLCIISLIPSQTFRRTLLFMLNYWCLTLLTLIILLIVFRYFLNKSCNSSLLVCFFARQYFRHVLFLLLIKIGMPFVIQGFALSFRSLIDSFLMEHVLQWLNWQW